MQEGAYTFTRGVIDLLWLYAPIAGPFIVLSTIVMVLKRANRSARGGGDLDDLQTDYQSVRDRLRQRTRQRRDTSRSFR